MHHSTKILAPFKSSFLQAKNAFSGGFLVLLTSLGFAQCFAQESSNNLMVYSVLGTGGLGLGMDKEMSNGFVLRAEVTNLSKSLQTTQDGINYSGSFNLTTTAVYADYHPWKSAFHLSSGINIKPTNISLAGVPTGGNLKINNTTYPVNPGQGINANITFPATMPYLGLGWGFGDLSKKSGFLFSSDMGFDFGKLDGSISATPGLFPGNAGFQSNLNTQSQKLSASVSAMRFFPIIKFQAGYAY